MNVHNDESGADNDDFAAMDDTALIGWRTQTREELQRLPPGSAGFVELSARYQVSTTEIDGRAREARARARNNGSLGMRK